MNHLGMDGVKSKALKYVANKKNLMSKVGAELGAVELDKITKTDPADNKNRRTLLVDKQNGSWGFTIQSYGIHHKATNEVQLLTYVDYVAMEGPSYLAGLRPGDVILSINGISMEDADHTALVGYIENCGSNMRMVVLFEDCCRKVELHLRYLKLQRVLAEKMFEFRALEAQERMIGNGTDPRRFSLAYSSNTSFASLKNDRLSLCPELDVCPSPRNHLPQNSVSPPSRGTSPLCSTPVPLGSRLEYERTTLPLTLKSRPQSASDLEVKSINENFVRENRPVSMSSNRSLDSISEIGSGGTGKLPRRPDYLAVPSLSTSASTSALEGLCASSRAKWRSDGALTPQSVYSPGGSTGRSSPDGHMHYLSSSECSSRSLTPCASRSSLTSPGSHSPRLKPRTSLRSRSFRHRMYSLQNPSPPNSSVVLTEENSREDGEPLLLGVKRIARAFSFRMPWEQKARNGEVYLEPPRNCDIHCQCIPQVVRTPCSHSDLQKYPGGYRGCDSVASMTPSPLKSYKSREMLAFSSEECFEMDSLTCQLDGVSVTSSGPTVSNGSVSSYASSATSGSYTLSDPFSSPETPTPTSSFHDLQLAKTIAFIDPSNRLSASGHYPLREHVNERDETTVL